MATIAPSDETISYKRKCSSILKDYGILVLPVALMVQFGMFGFRPDQLGKHRVGYVFNSIVILGYLLIITVGIGYFCNPKEYRYTAYKFMAVYVIAMVIQFTLLIFILYKDYNLLFLLRDMENVRRHSLERKELCLISLILTLILTMVIFLEMYLSKNINERFETWESDNTLYTIDTNDPILFKTFAILEGLIYMNTTNMSMVLTSLLVVVIAVVFSKEFEKCIQELRAEIKKDNSLSNNQFSMSVERFYELIAVVEKSDDLLSITVGFNVTVCLGMLCGGTYACFIGDGTFKEWHIPILISVVALAVLLPPLVALNRKVMIYFHLKYIDALEIFMLIICVTKTTM